MLNKGVIFEIFTLKFFSPFLFTNEHYGNRNQIILNILICKNTVSIYLLILSNIKIYTKGFLTIVQTDEL